MSVFCKKFHIFAASDTSSVMHNRKRTLFPPVNLDHLQRERDKSEYALLCELYIHVTIDVIYLHRCGRFPLFGSRAVQSLQAE